MHYEKLLFVLILNSLAYCSPITKEDLICGDKDSCIGSVSSYTERNCRCDSDCAMYGDCCEDAPNTSRALTKVFKFEFQCITVKTDSRFPDSFYMIADCPPSWDRGDIWTKCLSPDLNDFTQMIPVSDSDASLTFRNIFCALCHKANMDNLYPWDLKLECQSFKYNNTHDAKDFLIYNNKFKRWVVQSKNDSEMCQSTVKPAEKSEVILRPCEPKVINSCAKNWRHHQTLKLCKEQTAYRYLYGESGVLIYKNKYCAKCNYIDMQKLDCMQTKYASPVSRDLASYRGSSLLNFAIIMNSYLLKNTATKCSSGLVYNTATKNCEELHCSQDTVKLNGVCVDM